MVKLLSQPLKRLTGSTIARVLLILAALTVVTTVVYIQVGDFDFTIYDDNMYVTDNPMVFRGLRAEGIRWAFSSTDLNIWHPLTWISHMAVAEYFGLAPGMHHTVNLIIHVINTILLLLVLTNMTGRLWESAIVAAIFALHPLHVESVAWVSQRKDVLSAMFWFLTMGGYVCYVARPSWQRYTVVITFFILGILSKPIVIMLPAVLVLLDFWPYDRLGGMFGKDRHAPGIIAGYLPIIEKLPLFAISIATAVATYITQGSQGGIELFGRLSLSQRLSNAVISYVKYIAMTIWPTNLACFYPFDFVLPVWKVITSLLILILLTIVAILYIRKAPYILVGWLWYILSLVPVIGFVHVGGAALADRYIYIPLVGLAVAVVFVLSEAVSKVSGLKHLATLITVSTLCVYCLLTWRQVAVWKDSYTLFQHAANVTRNNYVAYFNLGTLMLTNSRYREAADLLQKAVAAKPDYMEAYLNLGNARFFSGDGNGALISFKKAAELNPDSELAHSAVGMVYLNQGKVDDAIQAFQKALSINPDLPFAIENLEKAQAIKQAAHSHP
ncbi:MAG: tetratricopeptide repeat protein [Nitrospirae bacterium]|uniref:tetratricopeptide repeat protein n=1 Tax=Candidatus Magnetobacterium casense TaxID=1455061 RepID=UPI000696F0B4|nr:tetratricopeptide repeat protein [Candidatus Magnetobacterium casensis]MBF0338603.1 tetratricopeptide repeat protein [Nitrospirota bacterium]